MRIGIRAGMALSLGLGLLGPAFAQTDVWVRLERIDVRPDGTPTQNSAALGNFSISDDGRWVVFAADASDLVAGDTNAKTDIFVRDRKTNVTRRVSMRADGTQTAYANRFPSISPDGRFITFNSYDSLLAANDANFTFDQFLLDRDIDGNGVFDEAGATKLELVSLLNGQTFFNGADQTPGAIDDHGRTVAYSTLQRLSADDTNSYRDIYARDRSASANVRVSQSSSGAVGNADSPGLFRPPIRMSGNGAVIVFASDATNLVAAGVGGILVRNRDSDGNGVLDEAGGTTTMLGNVDPLGAVAPIGPFAQFDLSHDGQWLAFAASTTLASNPGGDNIWLRDLKTGTVVPIPFDAGQWAKGNSDCCGNGYPLIAEQAGVVAFTSTQLYHFAQGITVGRSDACVKTRGMALACLTNFPVPGSQTDGYSAGIAALSRNGVFALVGITRGGTDPVPEEGVFVYRHDSVFAGNFEP